jgi:hypothetical protein
MTQHSQLEVSGNDRQDLIVLLRILEGWLLIAEPSTIRELDAYLKSEGITAASTEVLAGLEQMRRRLEA